MSSQSRDEQTLAGLVKDYVTRRIQRREEVFAILRKDHEEYLPFQLLFEAKPELKKAVGIPSDLASLNEVMRQVYAPDANKGSESKGSGGY